MGTITALADHCEREAQSQSLLGTVASEQADSARLVRKPRPQANAGQLTFCICHRERHGVTSPPPGIPEDLVPV